MATVEKPVSRRCGAIIARQPDRRTVDALGDRPVFEYDGTIAWPARGFLPLMSTPSRRHGWWRSDAHSLARGGGGDDQHCHCRDQRVGRRPGRSRTRRERHDRDRDHRHEDADAVGELLIGAWLPALLTR
jgi:hypothetical protein